MSTGLLLAALPALACGACLLLMCRPGSRSCHPDAGQEKAELQQEITDLRERLAAHETEPTSRT